MYASPVYPHGGRVVSLLLCIRTQTQWVESVYLTSDRDVQQMSEFKNKAIYIYIKLWKIYIAYYPPKNGNCFGLKKT